MAGNASASTSFAVPLSSLVENASAVVVVEPIESKSQWENGSIATYTHVRIVERVAGTAPDDAWIRTAGGRVGDIGQWVEGEADLRSRSLVFLAQAGSSAKVVGRAQGQYLAVAENGKLVLRPSPDAGRLVARRGEVAKAFPLAGASLDEASRQVREVWTVRHASR
ncbi:MAG: hypothetical protein HOO96_25470 [Polyangiaceae bacterium]|nr:hypothetical protein [Polyangiaceae bacterium]